MTRVGSQGHRGKKGRGGGKYKDDIKFDLESRIGGRKLKSFGSGQQKVMDIFKFLGYP